ncbi:MAG: alpha-L-glutamate ligase [Cryomorphaceae bacterium BACL21 MAG-121220-bin10]|jgi:ribosomal protein S6--L-glutamate ligase|nr:MAG: alpha-L-glutamate ligase [Cryomorphaceae bacterium BACL21 MAG-121220-bin10]MDA0700827.1 RimK family alpha-L-glutamate ligase [Bacteroidota bacterium]|tara:strand:- start:2460 stop:3332 length:873 start_codon:yes stop_codon:yes gene_type:complete
MNIAILSRGEHLYSTKSLLACGLKQHNIEVLDPNLCHVGTLKDQPVLFYGDELVDDLDAIIPRIGASNTYFGASLVRHFESMGVFSTVSAEAILQSRNKWTCHQILSAHGIPIPNTFLGLTSNPDMILHHFNEGPVVIKLLQGTHGEGVILAESTASARSIIETLNASKVRFLVQEYIRESQGCDIRAIVVDGAVVASMKRLSRSDDFRSNLHRGGHPERYDLTPEETQIALRAAKALDLNVCGVDILQSNRGPLLLEINSTPGLEGIENTTGIDVAQKIISYIERNKRS